ncbi:MAG: adenylate/guanylate cyclase domain-containing protein, partial [Candidatus Riflebacteria bacterium]|nr:adenylate/guanylate cyclase domain-containing protein [Candidatus Riflebacteria bacterium]
FNSYFLSRDSTDRASNRVVVRDSDSTKLLITLIEGQKFIVNALFDLSGASIQAAAERKAAHWNDTKSGLMYFGGGAKIRPAVSSWFARQPCLAASILRILDAGLIRQTSLMIDGYLVLFTPFDPKIPWQVAIAARAPEATPQKGMELLILIFAIAGCSIWKLLVEAIIFDRAINLSLRNFIILVFIVVTMMPFVSAIYLTGEFVIANFKVQKNKVAQELSERLMDTDLSTFSNFRDSINQVKALNSVEALAEFSEMPVSAEISELAKGILRKFIKLKGNRMVSKLWISSSESELIEVHRRESGDFISSPNTDNFISEIFMPRFRELFKKAGNGRDVTARKAEEISFDEVKGEIIDSIVLNMCGETTYFNLQKDLGTLIRLDFFLDRNAVISIPVTYKNEVKYVFSYIFSSSEIRGHFPEKTRSTDPAKPIIVTLYGNEKYMNALPENLQTLSEKYPGLYNLVRQSFLKASRLKMQDFSASGSPVIESLPAKYSDYIIGGQSNTRSLESISSELTAIAANYFAIMVFGGLLVALLTSLYFTIPVRQLNEATRKIIEEDYSVRLNENHPDEFAISAAAFNKMASGLAEGQLLRNFVSESVRDLSGKTAIAEAERAKITRATILFSSIQNFNALQKELNPEATFALMQVHLSAAVEMATRLGGEIDKMIEDKVMIVFSHSPDDKNSGENAALEAADYIKNHLAAQCGQKTAAGINSGDVVMGIMGAESVRLSKTVVGDTVNLAARLASVAAKLPDGGIVVSGFTAQQANENFCFEKLPINSVKGKTHTVEAFLATRQTCS